MRSENDRRSRWDRRYRGACADQAQAAGVLRLYRHWLPATGRALDLACGLGGNALLLAAAGLDTEAWDFSPPALEALGATARARGLAIRTRLVDVTREPPQPGHYDVIVVSQFLERELFATLQAALRPGGLLYYQTFTVEARSGPRNPAFRLAVNELVHAVPALVIRAYHEEGALAGEAGERAGQAWLVAQRPGEGP